MKLSELKPNKKNPRKLSNDNLERLKKSLQEFPAMMELRPIIVDESNMILGGNMRYKALKALGYDEIPDTWVKKASTLTDEEKRRFILADNASYGEFDYELLAKEWSNDIVTWDLPIEVMTDVVDEAITQENEEKKDVRVPFGDERDTMDIKELLSLYERVFVNFSGGKDSIATALYLKELDVNFELVGVVEPFVWFDIEDYMNYVAESIGVKLNLVNARDENYIMTKIRQYGFPSRANKWCNSQLKVSHLNDFYKKVKEKNIRCIGVRAEESSRRAKMTSRGRWNGADFIFPIFNFTTDDVLNIIKKHNIRLHSVYEYDNRMSCFVCPEMSAKKFALLRKYNPEYFFRALSYVLEGMKCEKYRNAYGLSQLETIIESLQIKDEDIKSEGLVNAGNYYSIKENSTVRQ